jgi:hypothetical protein
MRFEEIRVGPLRFRGLGLSIRVESVADKIDPSLDGGLKPSFEDRPIVRQRIVAKKVYLAPIR